MSFKKWISYFLLRNSVLRNKKVKDSLQLLHKAGNDLYDTMNKHDDKFGRYFKVKKKSGNDK